MAEFARNGSSEACNFSALTTLEARTQRNTFKHFERKISDKIKNYWQAVVENTRIKYATQAKKSITNSLNKAYRRLGRA